MFLTGKTRLISFSPFRSVVTEHSLPTNYDLISRSFDETVRRRLKDLGSPSSVGLTWLFAAVDFLSSTHDEAQKLISNLRSSSSDGDESVELYLDNSVKVLDICNSISSEIEKLRLRLLPIKVVLRLLEFPGEGVPAPEKIKRARDSLSDWGKNSRNKRGFVRYEPESLIRGLAAGIGSSPPAVGKSRAGKLVLLRRIIYAVGILTVFVSGVAVSTLYGLPEIARVRVPAEYAWADLFDHLQSAVFERVNRRFIGGEGRGLFEELDDVAARVEEVRGVIDGDKGVKKERLSKVVKELETATGKFSDGLERLSNGVNGVFNTVLSTRNSALESYRTSDETEKRRK